MNQKHLVQKVQEIATFADLFQVTFNQNKSPYQDMDSDWLQALQFFLHGYAFERQGRSPEYSSAGVEAVKRAVLTKDKIPDSEFPFRAWSEFLTILRLSTSKGANPTNNPLLPRNSSSKQSVTSLVTELKNYQYNLVGYLIDLLNQGKVKTAHQFLCRIRGTGNKINSLFLRDITLMYGISKNQDNVLLQPVDIWIRRLVRVLMGFSADVSRDSLDEYSEDTKIAQTVIFLCRKADVSPLAFNQGAWMFGARIAGTKTRLIQYVEDSLSPRDAINQRAKMLQEELVALHDMSQKFKC